ncbi:LysR family transcriptional regulator [Pseudomonas matsuisoli]|uniref:LysR family transcriptional regulator n=1 Tax=Pseudomonas matsuisoli TaxID=1515666 RepID=A0A917URE3_9PSED|nr:LysR family transcriptional regulator [Pseudomonas matsuisoli]GGJ78906.1 LysR family transcriptional regulator [Pseudomonas matsuisoli]
MQLRSLKYFDAVARCRSIRQAAERLHVAPTALSRQIAQLEYDLGASLIERSPKGVRLTPAGELLAAQAERTLGELHDLRDRITDLRELGAGHVSLHVSEGLAAGLVAPVLAELGRDHPRLRFSVTIASAPAIVQSVREQSCDIGVAFFIPEEEGIVRTRVGQLDQYLIVGAEHPLARFESVRFEALLGLPLALPDTGYGVRRTLNRLAEARGTLLRPAYVTPSIEMQKSLLRARAAALVLPRLAVEHECASGEFKALAIEEPALRNVTLDLCTSARAQPNAAVQATLDRFEQAFREEEGVALMCAG